MNTMEHIQFFTFLYIFIDIVYGWQTFLSAEQVKNARILPWIGVLKVRSGNTEYATGLTLISERLAAANSHDISKLHKETLRISTKAIFFKYNIPWYCDVADYEIHPEFNDITLINALAVLFLDCDRQNWASINWPDHKKDWDNVFVVGLNDRNYDFEQTIFRMKFVNSSKCLSFYVKEELDFKRFWPKHFLCSKALNMKRKCVFDTGMALVSVNNGYWTLLGISTRGPGCILPSRFIDILPYTSWMNKQRYKQTLSSRRQMDDSNSDGDHNKNRTAIDPAQDIVNDVSDKEDDFYVQKLNDSTMVLRPKFANVKELVYGNCENDKGDIMYRDAGVVRTKKKPATGVYALSLYDMRYYGVTCVMVTVVCDSRSVTKFWYEMGFKAEDFEDLVNVVPHYVRGQHFPPHKILFLTDFYYKYEHILTSNLVFKFEFTGEAIINVDFYGVRVVTTGAHTTTTTTPRKRRTHRYHLFRTPGWVPIENGNKSSANNSSENNSSENKSSANNSSENKSSANNSSENNSSANNSSSFRRQALPSRIIPKYRTKKRF